MACADLALEGRSAQQQCFVQAGEWATNNNTEVALLLDVSNESINGGERCVWSAEDFVDQVARLW